MAGGTDRDAGDDGVIRLENIHKSFGHLEVLRGIDLEVSRGEVVVVIGPSGSGKSTLLRVINYLEPYQQGTIYLNGTSRSISAVSMAASCATRSG